MNKPLLLAAPAVAMALLIAACSSDGRPHEAEYPTATEQTYGASSGQPSTMPAGSVGQQPAPGKPMTVPQPTSRQSAAMAAPSDTDFVQQQISSSALEIELGRIAVVRAQSQDVRSFARQMLIDHRQMVIRLDDFALQRGHLVAWQIEPEGVNAIERMRSIDAASFDRAYMDEMVTKHETAVSKLEIQSASGRETAPIATEALPTVRHHLAMAREVQAEL